MSVSNSFATTISMETHADNFSECVVLVLHDPRSIYGMIQSSSLIMQIG
jgi:hypothetical protein